jgi:hypothetical protein
MLKSIGETNFNDTVVSDRGYTRGQLDEAFKLIANSKNWKFPVDAVIDSDKFPICDEACVFFTGSKLEIVESLTTHLIRVKADGYYLTIGA